RDSSLSDAFIGDHMFEQMNTKFKKNMKKELRGITKKEKTYDQICKKSMKVSKFTCAAWYINTKKKHDANAFKKIDFIFDENTQHSEELTEVFDCYVADHKKENKISTKKHCCCLIGNEAYAKA